MITRVVEYTIDAAKIWAFERFGRAWIAVVNNHGGTTLRHRHPAWATVSIAHDTDSQLDHTYQQLSNRKPRDRHE